MGMGVGVIRRIGSCSATAMRQHIDVHRKKTSTASITKGTASGSQTYMHGVVLVEFRVLLHLAHHNDNGGDAGEDAILGGALIVLPCTNEM